MHFKFAVMQGEEPVQWEDKIIENRTYTSSGKNVVLKSFFNDPDLIELIQEKESIPEGGVKSQVVPKLQGKTYMSDL